MIVAERGNRRSVSEADQPASSITQTGWTTRSSIDDAKPSPGSADASLTLSDVAPRLVTPRQASY